MGTIWVRELTGGLDTRRMPETTPGGVLTRGDNGHITRGGEFESRAAFVKAFDLPANTFGLAADRDSLVVFGSAAAPTMPTGVRYQRLQHPNGNAMTAVPSSDLFTGKIYASAEFDGGSRLHFYDGEKVDISFDGRARAAFRVTGGANVEAVPAKTSFTISAGTVGSGNQITSVKVDGVSIIGSSPIAFVTDFAATAAAVATQINASSSVLSITGQTQGPTPGTSLDGATAVAVAGDFAYVACAGRASVAVFNISDPTSPLWVAEFRGPTPGTSLAGASAIIVRDTHAYVACATRASLAVLDISTPSAIEWVAEDRGTTPGTTYDGACALVSLGTRLLMSCSAAGRIATIDIGTPDAPTLLGSVQDTKFAGCKDIAIAGNYAYVACSTRASVAVFSTIKSRDHLTYLREIRGPAPGTTMAGASGVAVVDDHVFVACATAKTIVPIDVSTPTLPVVKTPFAGPGTGLLDGAAHLATADKRLFVSNATADSIVTVDVRTPDAPKYVTKVVGTAGTTLDGSAGLFLAGQLLYVAAANRDGLVIVNTAGDWYATSTNATVTITCGVAGTYGNDRILEVKKGGDVEVTGVAPFAGGTTAKRSRLKDLKIAGKSVIEEPVPFTVDNNTTAGLIAAAVNDFSGDVDYVAVAKDNLATIYYPEQSARYNGLVVEFELQNDMAVSPATGLTMSGGLEPADANPGAFVKAIGTKVYTTSANLLSFSGIRQPLKWTTDTVGAGFIDMSAEISGALTLYAVAKYQSFVAVFAENTTLIYYVDPDPTLNKLAQVLENTGTTAPKSVVQYGDNDVFYLDESGIRSLRARDASNSATTTDIGVPVDSLVLDKLQAQTILERRKNIGVINPADGRLWMVMGDTVFVFSYFPNSKVSAWTTYTPSREVDGEQVPFAIEDVVIFNRRIYVRSGDEVFVYGGESGPLVYDGATAIAWLPYFDANKPAAIKFWHGFDAAVRGNWRVFMAAQPTHVDAYEEIVSTLMETTFNAGGRLPIAHQASHLSLRFESLGQGPHILSSIVIHHDADDDPD